MPRSLTAPLWRVAGPVALAGLLVVSLATAAAGADEPIPLTPVSDLTSIDATVTIQVDGSIEGEPTQGDLTAVLTSNSAGSRRIDVTGSLLGDVVAKVGGSAVKLFRPNRVSVYTVPEGTFVTVAGLFEVCIKPKDSLGTQTMEQLSPQLLMATVTGSDVARGTFVGEETLDGRAVRRYAIGGEQFLAAAKASADPLTSTFAGLMRSAADADLFVAADGGYPVGYRGGFSGAYEPLQLDGDFAVEIDVTGINQDTPIELPGSCDHPIST